MAFGLRDGMRSPLLVVLFAVGACGELGSHSSIGDDFGGEVGGGPGGTSGGGIDPGGAQDIAAAREIINNGQVPAGNLITVEGLLSEHDVPTIGPKTFWTTASPP